MCVPNFVATIHPRMENQGIIFFAKDMHGPGYVS
jgi:hypothetical protein